MSIPPPPTVDSPRPERVIHRALKNLMNEWGVTRAGVVAEIIKTITVKVDVEQVFRSWLDGHLGRFNQIAREVVKAMAEPVIRNEARAFLDRRVKLKVDVQATITPEEPTP